ncbi:hypothetical protein N826_36290 [Skermanella aerolata KACC 11604]|nr:hypothetical protein N826_36290 [Skermanella aerolata KACC 11604]
MNELSRCGIAQVSLTAARHQDPGDYPSGDRERRRNGPHRHDR